MRSCSGSSLGVDRADRALNKGVKRLGVGAVEAVEVDVGVEGEVGGLELGR